MPVNDKKKVRGPDFGSWREEVKASAIVIVCYSSWTDLILTLDTFFGCIIGSMAHTEDQAWQVFESQWRRYISFGRSGVALWMFL